MPNLGLFLGRVSQCPNFVRYCPHEKKMYFRRYNAEYPRKDGQIESRNRSSVIDRTLKDIPRLEGPLAFFACHMLLIVSEGMEYDEEVSHISGLLHLSLKTAGLQTHEHISINPQNPHQSPQGRQTNRVQSRSYAFSSSPGKVIGGVS